MRISRFVFSLWLLLVGVVGVPVLVSGCWSGSETGEVKVEANKEEQQLLHDQMQKGFARQPTSNRK